MDMIGQLSWTQLSWIQTRFPNRMWVTVVLTIVSLFVAGCNLITPTPTDEQVIQAVVAFNEAWEEPLMLVHEESQIPHQYPGKAGAVAWVEDKSIQINYLIAYDRSTKTFYVSSYSMYHLDEDGVYREV